MLMFIVYWTKNHSIIIDTKTSASQSFLLSPSYNLKDLNLCKTRDVSAKSTFKGGPAMKVVKKIRSNEFCETTENAKGNLLSFLMLERASRLKFNLWKCFSNFCPCWLFNISVEREIELRDKGEFRLQS